MEGTEPDLGFQEIIVTRGTRAGKGHKAWALPRFWVSIRSYKKQPVKKNLG